MGRRGGVLLCACVLLISAGRGAGQEGTATLPLDRILSLYRQTERAQPEARPPFSATLDRIELSGRLLEDALDLKAHFELTVLPRGEWVVVPLVVTDPATVIRDLPSVDSALVTTRDNQLVFVTDQAGTYRFDVSLLKRAEEKDGLHRVQLRHPAATLAVMRLAFDAALFELVVPTARDGTGAIIYSDGHQFALEWRSSGPTKGAATAEEKRPPAPTSITTARASVVSTLQGQRITRVQYDLQFEGRQQLALSLPPGQRLDAVYQNGQSSPFRNEAGRVALDITPAQAGGETRIVELVLTGDRDAYLLSGRLDVQLPAVNWPINELTCEVALPEVFNYTTSGGSLSPVAEVPPAQFVRRLPTPGRKLAFHQYLIDATTPNVVIDYSVNLAGQYFSRPE